MKKWIAVALCAVVLFAVGCSFTKTDQEEDSTEYQLYFLEGELKNAAGGEALRAETITVEKTEYETAEDLAEILLTRMLQGPIDLTLQNPIPNGTSLLSVDIHEGQAHVDFSAPYNGLSGIRLTLADYAITLTLTQLPEILTTTITVHGQELAYRDRQTFGVWDVLRMQQEDVVSTLESTVYFPNTFGGLQPEQRSLELYEGDTQVERVAAAVKEGPQQATLLPAIPEDWDVSSVWLRESTCYVDLSTALLGEGTNYADIKTALLALSRSLCSLETVEEVRFLVDGAFAEYYGPLEISEAYTS